MNPPSQRIVAQTTFECYTSMSVSSENTTRPFTVSTDIKVIDNSCDEEQSRFTISMICIYNHLMNLSFSRC